MTVPGAPGAGETTTGRATPWALVWASTVRPGAGGGPAQVSVPTTSVPSSSSAAVPTVTTPADASTATA